VLAEGYKIPVSDISNSGKPRRAYIPCPECGKIMNPKQFAGCSGIIIDCCRTHGNWFDRRELQQVVVFIQKGGMMKSRKLEMDRAREEAKKDWHNRNFGSNLKKFLSDPLIKAPDDSGHKRRI